MRLTVPFAATLAAGAIAMVAPPAHAGPDDPGEAVCRLHAPLQSTRLLRRASLAMLGRVPTIDEYYQVEDLEPDSDGFNAIIDSWFDSSEYSQQMRRYHMQLLWANPDGVSLRDNGMMLSRLNLGGGDFLWRNPSTLVRRNYRGGDGTHSCQNIPQTQIQPGYQLGDKPTCQDQGSDAIGPYCQEGYTMVTPFFDKSLQLKVCAFDAQTASEYTIDTGTSYDGTYSCSDWQARVVDTKPGAGVIRVDDCGCGPDLGYCMFGSPYLQDLDVTGAMREQMLRLVDDYTKGQAPYSEMLTTKKAYIDGTLSHYFRYHAPMAAPSRTHNAVYGEDFPLSDGEWGDNKWIQVERGANHSGLLTLPAYLLRFQTNRGRANRFRIAFMGQHFVPSEGPASENCDPDSDDVTKKCYCESCHTALEPMSMFFGSFAEAGSSSIAWLGQEFIDDSSVGGAQDLLDCRNQWLPVGNSWCYRFYSRIKVQDPLFPDDPTKLVNAYRLKPLEFGETHPDYETNMDEGPAGLLAAHALKPLQGKEYSFFAWATVRNLYGFLVGRDLDLDPLSADNEQKMLDELALKFESSNFDFKLLVKEIVSLPTFRRMP